MIDFRKVIYKVLSTDETVCNWVAKLNGLPNISTNVSTNAVFPLIILYEVSTIDAVSSGNNVVDVYETFWQIALFSKTGGTAPVKKQVDKLMHGLGFKLYGLDETFNQDTKVTETVLRYSQMISQEHFDTLEKQILMKDED